MDGDEGVEGWVEFVGGDAVVADVELLEDGLVEEPAAVVGGLPVCLLEVVEEVEGGFEQFGSDVELVVGVVELFVELAALFVDAVEAPTDLGLGHLVVGGQADQVVLLDVELGELGLELLVEEPGGLLLVGEGFVEQSADLVPEGGVELDGGVVLDHGVFDLVHVAEGGCAGVLFATAAEEVPVGAAAPVGPLDDHPVLLAPPAPE